jgi:hypothetical protein
VGPKSASWQCNNRGGTASILAEVPSSDDGEEGVMDGSGQLLGSQTHQFIWETDYQRALERVRAERKELFVYFTKPN